jgi:hypothetical protein
VEELPCTQGDWSHKWPVQTILKRCFSLRVRAKH